MSVMIGLPSFNESNTITKIICKSQKFGTVVVVDDGSTDNTYRLAQKLGAIVISHDKNMGYGKSISDLFTYAKKKNFSILVTLDTDNQHNPDEIPEFIKALETSDIVTGNRFMSDSEVPKYREFGIKTISKLSGVKDAQCGFRIYNKRAISLMADKLYESDMGISVEILKVAQLNNLRITEIPCTVQYNKESHSQNPLSQGFKVLTSLFWTIIWENPTKTLFLPGLVALIISVITGIQTINLYIQFHLIILSWALFTIGLMMCGILILNIFTFIFVFKNKRMEK